MLTDLIFLRSAVYLEKHYDPDHKFAFPGDEANGDDYRSEVLQWLFFVHGGVGPMQGQANWWSHQEEKVPKAIERYRNETKRLYDVLHIRLADRDYLVGEDRGRYSIGALSLTQSSTRPRETFLTVPFTCPADINAFPWVFWSPFAGIPHSEHPPSVRAWVQRLWARPEVKAGMNTPVGREECVFASFPLSPRGGQY